MTRSLLPIDTPPPGPAAAGARLGLLAVSLFLGAAAQAAEGGTYDGRAPDAPWRAEAAQRIDEFRKRDVHFYIHNPQGQPVPGARVRLRQVRHAFQFGADFDPTRVADQSVKANQRYLDMLATLFTAASPAPGLVWTQWNLESGAPNDALRNQTAQAVELLEQRDLALWWKPLIDPSRDRIPSAYHALIDSSDPLMVETANRRVQDISAFATAVGASACDMLVLQNPCSHTDLISTYGNGVMVDWFNLAAAPSRQLFISEGGVLSAEPSAVQQQDLYENTIRAIREGGGALSGIGFEAHFGANPAGIPRIWEILERYATAFPDTALRLTAFDIATEDEALQADFIRDLLTIAFSHPRMTGIQFSDLWAAGASPAALFHADWQEKPAAAALRDLLQGEWRTDIEQLTCECGDVKTRGFLGTYAYEVTAGGITKSGTFTVTGDELTSVDVEIDISVPQAPAIMRQPFGGTYAPGTSVTLQTVAAGDPLARIIWYRDGQVVGSGRNLKIQSLSAHHAGNYHAVASNDFGEAQTRTVRLAVQPAGPQTGRLTNLSTRGRVGTGVDAMILGFVAGGDGARDVVIRGIGPRLREFGFDDALVDPRIALFAAGAGAPTSTNDDWNTELDPEFNRLGAFGLGDDTKSAALRLELQPGLYTVELNGAENDNGMGLVEIYDSPTGPGGLVNLSTRGRVTAETKLVGGFVITGNEPQAVLIRGIGPGLAPFGVDQHLANPVLRLYDSVDGGQPRLLLSNDDWASSGFTEIRAAGASTGAFTLPTGSLDAATIVWLEPGAYTTEISSADGTPGIALVEVYQLP